MLMCSHNAVQVIIGTHMLPSLCLNTTLLLFSTLDASFINGRALNGAVDRWRVTHRPVGLLWYLTGEDDASDLFSKFKVLATRQSDGEPHLKGTRQNWFGWFAKLRTQALWAACGHKILTRLLFYEASLFAACGQVRKWFAAAECEPEVRYAEVVLFFKRRLAASAAPFTWWTTHCRRQLTSTASKICTAKSFCRIQVYTCFLFISGFWSGTAEPWKVQPVLTEWCLNIYERHLPVDRKFLFICLLFSYIIFFCSWWCWAAACITPLRPE